MADLLISNPLPDFDTIVVPAHPKGFGEVFLAEKRWPNLKIDKRKLMTVKFIAVYQTGPVSAITHYAEIARFEALQRVGRYDVILKGEPIEINHVRYTNSDICAVQGPRYTNLELVLTARHLARAFPT